MQAPEGGYYASLDADTEGEEGKFYLWQENEMKAILTSDEYDIVKLHFGLNKAANFEQHWHLYVAKTPEQIANALNLPLQVVQSE